MTLTGSYGAVLDGLRSIQGRTSLLPDASGGIELTRADEIDVFEGRAIEYTDEPDLTPSDATGRPPWWFDGCEHLNIGQLFALSVAYRKYLAATSKPFVDPSAAAASARQSSGGTGGNVTPEQRRAHLAGIDVGRAVKAMWTFDAGAGYWIAVFYPDPKGLILTNIKAWQASAKNPDVTHAKGVYAGELPDPLWPETQDFFTAVRPATDAEFAALSGHFREVAKRKDKPYTPPKPKGKKGKPVDLDALL